jgi:hypothetical protein
MGPTCHPHSPPLLPPLSPSPLSLSCRRPLGKKLRVGAGRREERSCARATPATASATRGSSSTSLVTLELRPPRPRASSYSVLLCYRRHWFPLGEGRPHGRRSVATTTTAPLHPRSLGRHHGRSPHAAAAKGPRPFRRRRQWTPPPHAAAPGGGVRMVFSTEALTQEKGSHIDPRKNSR